MGVLGSVEGGLEKAIAVLEAPLASSLLKRFWLTRGDLEAIVQGILEPPQGSQDSTLPYG